MSKERCSNCRFWDRISKSILEAREEEQLVENSLVFVGECRRYPPRCGLSEKEDAPQVAARWFNTSFPITDTDEWCGEWKPKRRK